MNTFMRGDFNLPRVPAFYGEPAKAGAQVPRDDIRVMQKPR